MTKKETLDLFSKIKNAKKINWKISKLEWFGFNSYTISLSFKHEEKTYLHVIDISTDVYNSVISLNTRDPFFFEKIKDILITFKNNKDYSIQRAKIFKLI